MRLLSDEAKFRESFKRFKVDSCNGFSSEKLARLGQECQVVTVYYDKTITAVFVDDKKQDYPWESVAVQLETVRTREIAAPRS